MKDKQYLTIAFKLLLYFKIAVTPFLLVWGYSFWYVGVEAFLVLALLLDLEGQFKRFSLWYKQGLFKAKVRKREYADFVAAKRKELNYKN